MHKEENIENEELFKALMNGGGVQHTLDIAGKILRNPVVMFDIAYNLLACTENTVTDDPLWNELTSLGTFSHETVNFIFKQKFIEVYAESDAVSVMKSSKLKYDRANSKIFDRNGVQIATILTVACYKPLEDNDLVMLETISKILSDELQKSERYHEIEHVFPETFMTDLIEGKNADKTMSEHVLNSLYTDLKTDLYIAVVDIAQYDPTLTHLVYFKDLFEKMQTEYKYYVYLNYIVILMSSDNSIFNIKKDMGGLKKFFEKYGIFAGVSSSFQNLFEAQKYYKQALHALNYGIKDKDGGHIFKYDNYRLDYLLNSIKDSINIWDLCNPIVFSILDYDKKNNTNFYDILRVSFLSGGNSQLACSTMKMDDNKFHEQLKKMEEVFEIDWDNGNMKLSIFISMKILDYYS